MLDTIVISQSWDKSILNTIVMKIMLGIIASFSLLKIKPMEVSVSKINKRVLL